MNSNNALDLKSKRIVYQMSLELEQTDVNHDFHNALLSLQMPDLDKNSGFDGFLKLQEDIKESLRNFMRFGQKSDLLSQLNGQQLKCVSQMLKSRSTTSSSGKTSNGEYSGERIRAKSVKAVEEDIPPVPFGIPPLEVNGLYRDDGLDEEEHYSDMDWLNSQRSSRFPEEPIPKSAPVKSKTPEVPKSVKFSEPVKKIASRARPIQKSDAQIQTDQLVLKKDEQEENLKKTSGRSEKITAETGTNCRLLITPRVEEDFSGKSSPLLSPISTVPSDISEGEVLGPVSNVIVVRTDGSIVPTPRVLEDDEENILIAKSVSPFGVAEIDMSISSAHSH
ncbi:hypothetical protein L3Y34_014223 [Caenorhabditis briggsae]|uniref:Uncharacterized protein n=1 Tax=Caenorhabditis briggsae TaxID=6238 RepID=A0AAE9DS28_CAEBR|nr:hypothetical protein L3Y34_014223 [Caenorhabditis briggsae]